MLRCSFGIFCIVVGLSQSCSSSKKPRIAPVAALEKRPDPIEPDLTRIPEIDETSDPISETVQPSPVPQPPPNPGPPQPDPQPSPEFEEVEGAPVKVQQLSMGDHNICGLTFNGKVVCWGENNGLQISLTAAHSAFKDPTEITFPAAFIELKTATSHSCARDSAGQVYCWGINYSRMVNPASAEEYFDDIQRVDVPFPAKKIAVTPFNSCAIGEGGQAYCWGNLRPFYLPKVTNARSSNFTTDIASEKPVRDVVLGQGSGADMSCLIFTDDDARCWKKAGTTAEFELSEFHGVSKIAMDVTSGCILFRNGRIQCWGKFAKVSLDEEVQDIAVSSHHLCVITLNQKAACMGENNWAQLGFPIAEVQTQDSLRIVPGDHSFESIEVNRNMTCAIDRSKAVYCWGKRYPGIDYGIDYGPDESARIYPLKRESPTLVRWPLKGETS